MYRRQVKVENDEHFPYVLDNQHDAANLLMSKNWNIPSEIQAQELMDNTTYEAIDNYNNSGTRCYVLTSKINGEKVVFPVGAFSGNSWKYSSIGYWTNILYEPSLKDNHIYAYRYSPGLNYKGDLYRYQCLPIRAVYAQ